VAGLTGAGAIFGGRAGRLVLVAGGVVIAGLVLTQLRISSVAAPRLAEVAQRVLMTGTLVRAESRADGSRRLLLEDVVVATPGSPTALARVRVTERRAGPPLLPGTRLQLVARLVPPPPPVRPDGYDFQRAAWFQQIGAIGSVLSPITVVRQPEASGGSVALEQLRQRASRLIMAAVPGERGALLVALLVGERAGLSEETMTAVKTAGLAHVIAISGFHLTLVAGAVFWMARRVLAVAPGIHGGRLAKPLAALTAALVALAYTLFSGGALPTWRACAAVTLIALAVALGRHPFSLRLVALAALGILIVWPESLMNVSFQLSFAAVTALIAASEAGLFARVKALPYVALLPAPLLGLVDISVASMVSEIALAPIAITQFHQQGIYGLIANLVVIPLASFLILPLGLVGLMLALAGGPDWLLLGAGLTGGWMLDVARVVASWPAALQLYPAVPTAVMPCFVLGGLLLVLLAGRARWLSVLPLGTGMMLALTATPPDVRITPEGGLVAVRLPNGALAYSSGARDPFAQASWAEAAAMPERWTWAGLGLAGAEPACADRRCTALIPRGGRTWRVVIDDARAPPTCPQTDVWIVPHRRAVGQCPVPTLDRTWFARQGATELWLPARAGDAARIRTSTAVRGAHPWVTGAAGAQ
jgi:competence protein ComEC